MNDAYALHNADMGDLSVSVSVFFLAQSSKHVRAIDLTMQIDFTIRCVHVHTLDTAIFRLLLLAVDFPKAVKRLLKNDILMFRTASSVLHILPIAGLYTFLPKYLESQFRLPAHHANMISGNYQRSISATWRSWEIYARLLMTCAIRNSDVVVKRSARRRGKISLPDVRRDYEAK